MGNATKAIPRAINNNESPFGGGDPNVAGNCNWNVGYGTSTSPAITGSTPQPGYMGGYDNNCGPNDEIFSFHGGGANVLFMDGHVSFLVSETTPRVVRFLVTSQEGVEIPAGTNY